MVAHCGMSDKLGTVFYSNQYRISQETERLIDEEVRTIFK